MLNIVPSFPFWNFVKKKKGVLPGGKNTFLYLSTHEASFTLKHYFIIQIPYR